MGLPRQTVSLLNAARALVQSLPAHAVLILPEKGMDWEAVRDNLSGCKMLIAADNPKLRERLRELSNKLTVIDLEQEPMPMQERMSLALLKGIAAGHLKPGEDVVVLYNGLVGEEDRPEPVDSLSVIHLGEHLERLTGQDLQKLQLPIPIETLRVVVDLAADIGREGREGQKVGTLLVVGDVRKVQSMSRPINFNPFRGYSKEERDLSDRRVREQIKEIAKMDGAILIDRDGIAVAGCLYLDVPADGVSVSKGFGSRHWAAAAISRKTQAVAVCVSQSTGTVRLFHEGEVVLHIEPLSRPHIFQPFRLDTQEKDEDDDSERDGVRV